MTPRQVEVIRYLADGKRYSEIAELIGRTESAVKTHVHRAMDVCGAATSAGLVAIVLRRGLIK